MRPYTDEQKAKMLENGRNPDQDHAPVVMLELFAGNKKMCWLLSQLDPEEPTYAFGLCDLGEGFPELGDVYLPEIVQTAQECRLFLSRDDDFVATHPMSVYAEAARNKREITIDPTALMIAANRLRIRAEQQGPAFIPLPE